MKIRILAFSLVLVATHVGNAYQAQKQLSDIELREKIIRALRDGTAFLKGRQTGEGSWSVGTGALKPYTVGLTSLSLLSMIHSGVPPESPVVQRGLSYLRNLPPTQPKYVYEASLMVMALCAADEPGKDRSRIARLTDLLERTQASKGKNSGLWGYFLATRGGSAGGSGDEDRSNGQYAVLALRDAAYAGIRIDRDVWLRTHEHWIQTQNGDGGWGYRAGEDSRGTSRKLGLQAVDLSVRPGRWRLW